MIISCISCGKKFNVNSELIPSNGRTIQCGSCNHVWFYNPKKIEESFDNENKFIDIVNTSKKEKVKKTQSKKIINKNEELTFDEDNNKRNYELTKYKEKSNFSFNKFLSYIIVTIISFVAVLILLDTFKVPLYQMFPNLELVMFSLFELLKDIKLFIKDLF